MDFEALPALAALEDGLRHLNRLLEILFLTRLDVDLHDFGNHRLSPVAAGGL